MSGIEDDAWGPDPEAPVATQERKGPQQLTPDEILGRTPKATEITGAAAAAAMEAEEKGEETFVDPETGEVLPIPPADPEPAPVAKEDDGISDEQENVLGEKVSKAEALKGPPKTGTAYKVFRSELIDYEPEDTFTAWVEVGAATASTQRAAIIEVVGAEAAGDFMAIPASSAQVHPRREKRVFGWED